MLIFFKLSIYNPILFAQMLLYCYILIPLKKKSTANKFSLINNFKEQIPKRTSLVY